MSDRRSDGTDPASGDVGARNEVRLQVSLLGGFALSANGRPLDVRSHKAQALVAYLALTATHAETRERLAGLLWSESGEANARASLRQSLRDLRTLFAEAGFPGFETARRDVRLDGALLCVDVRSVLETARRGGVHPLLLSEKRLAESLLPGLDDVDPSFRAWLLVQRQTLHERLVRHLEDALDGDDADPARRKALAEGLGNLDPTHEGACQHLMRLHAETGNVAGALRTYKALWDLLDDEYGMEPSDETQALVAAIKSGTLRPTLPVPVRPAGPVDDAPGTTILPPAAVRAGGLPGGVRRKILMAVKPFDARAVGDDRLHVVHGFRHDLIARLVRFRDWSVIDAPRGAGPGLPDPETASLYAVEASVFPMADALLLVLTLQEPETGVVIWSDRYELGLRDWLEAQLAIVRRIAVALNVHLSAERMARAAGRPEVSLDLFDRWLRGQELSFRWQPEHREQAEGIFRSIVADAPLFAPAYSSLVQLMNSRHIVFPGLHREPGREREALAMAKAAVEVDPIDSRTHLCLAWSLALNRQHDPAELAFHLAYELNENDPWTLVSTALGKAFCGAEEQARRLADQALGLGFAASGEHWGYQGTIRFICGDYPGTVDAADRARDHIANLPAWKAAALAHLGRIDEARRESRRFVELIGARWYGPAPPDEAAVTEWFLHCFPIRKREAWERLRDGLHRAGLPFVPSPPQAGLLAV